MKSVGSVRRMRTRAEIAEDYGYYHWKCRDCGMSGWTDTMPDCACRETERQDLIDDTKEENIE